MNSEELTATARELVTVTLMRAQWIMIVDAAVRAVRDESFHTVNVRASIATALQKVIDAGDLMELNREICALVETPGDTTDEGKT